VDLIPLVTKACIRIRIERKKKQKKRFDNGQSKHPKQRTKGRMNQQPAME
jgi:hypothetical protein